VATRAGSISVRIDGLNAVVRALLELGLEVDDLKDAFSQIARFGAIEGSRFAPKLTGRLAGDVRGNRSRNRAVITAGRSSVPYAGVINFGWAAHGIAPSMFMQKADVVLQPYALQRLEDDINDAIRRRGLA
jgi:phage gpG-like protein